MRDKKPPAVNKLWNDPSKAPPDRVAQAEAAIREWNSHYNKVGKIAVQARERDNAAYAARQKVAAPAAEATPAAKEPATPQTRFESYGQARKAAQDLANRLGYDVGIWKTKEYGIGKEGYNVRSLPQPKNRYGHELQAEVVSPTRAAPAAPAPAAGKAASLPSLERVVEAVRSGDFPLSTGSKPMSKARREGVIQSFARSLLERAKTDPNLADRLRSLPVEASAAAPAAKPAAAPAGADKTQGWLDRLKAAEGDRKAFMSVLDAMHADKSVSNKDMNAVAQAYGYGGTPLKQTRTGIALHIADNHIRARRFENKIAPGPVPESVPGGPLRREVAKQHMWAYDEGWRGRQLPKTANDAEQAAWDRGAQDRKNAGQPTRGEPEPKAAPNWLEELVGKGEQPAAKAPGAAPASRTVGEFHIEPKPGGGHQLMRGDQVLSEHPNLGQAYVAMNKAARAAGQAEPLRRDVLERGRGGRPIRTAPLKIGSEGRVLEAGAARATEPKGVTGKKMRPAAQISMPASARQRRANAGSQEWRRRACTAQDPRWHAGDRQPAVRRERHGYVHQLPETSGAGSQGRATGIRSREYRESKLAGYCGARIPGSWRDGGVPTLKVATMSYRQSVKPADVSMAVKNSWDERGGGRLDAVRNHCPSAPNPAFLKLGRKGNRSERRNPRTV